MLAWELNWFTKLPAIFVKFMLQIIPGNLSKHWIENESFWMRLWRGNFCHFRWSEFKCLLTWMSEEEREAQCFKKPNYLCFDLSFRSEIGFVACKSDHNILICLLTQLFDPGLCATECIWALDIVYDYCRLCSSLNTVNVRNEGLQYL